MTQVVEKTRKLPKWKLDFQTSARAEFEKVGLPTGKEEAWRFTPISSILKTTYAPASNVDTTDLVEQFTFGDDACAELVFINGQYSQLHSRVDQAIDGLTITTLADACCGPEAEVLKKHLGKVLAKPGAFALQNQANFVDGVFVHVRRSATISRPVHLLFITVGASKAIMATPRTLVVVEENAELQIVETYAGSGANYLTNAVTEIVAAQDARIDHCKLQMESTQGDHLATMQVELARKAQFVSHSISIGGRVARNDLGIRLSGEHADATLNGLVLINGTQHCDNHTLLDHAAPNCPSHELYKYVLNGKSTAVFKGKIYVHQIAQKTNAKQTTKSLLLSDDAVMNSQPALEIYADDVKCTHGSTTGPIDEESVFYLRSRGVGLEAARHLLTYAFAADITRRIRIEPVRRRVEDYMANQHGLPQDLRINDLGAHDAAVTQ